MSFMKSVASPDCSTKPHTTSGRARQYEERMMASTYSAGSGTLSISCCSFVLYPPTLSQVLRPRCIFSMVMTLAPSLAASREAIMPPMPQPITRKSHVSVREMSASSNVLSS